MKYRNKTEIVDVVLFDGTNKSIANIMLNLLPDDGVNVIHGTKDGCLEIPSLDGTIIASVGDYVIKDVHGVIHTCKPDVFEQTYEEVK